MATGDIHTLPHVPVHDMIAEQETFFFDQSHIIFDLCRSAHSEGDELDLRPLIERMKEIVAEQKPDDFDTYQDAAIASHILRALQTHGYDTTGRGEVKATKTDLFRAVDRALLRQLAVMLHIRRDEAYFSEMIERSRSGARIDAALRERVDSYHVRPTTVSSFMQALYTPAIYSYRNKPNDDDYIQRMTRLIATAAGYQNSFKETVAILSAYLLYQDSERHLFALSDAFAPIYNNPDIDCSDFTLAQAKEWDGGRVDYANTIYCGLYTFLESDVAGFHFATDAILHDSSTNAQFKFNLPEKIAIEEGETLTFDNVFETNVVGVEPNIRVAAENLPEGSQDRFIINYDPDANRLTIRAKQNYDNHEQYVISIYATAEMTNMSWTRFDDAHDIRDIDAEIARLRKKVEKLTGKKQEEVVPETTHADMPIVQHPVVTAQSKMTIVNLNEPPTFAVDYPTSIKEGGIFCMEAIDVADPEGDEVAIDWKQTGGRTLTLLKHDGGFKVCAQTPVTEGLENPYQFEVTARDIMPSEHADLETRTATQLARVNHIPFVRMADGALLYLPEEAVGFLTDPDEHDPGATVVATETSLYILMRLPTDIENFGYRLNGNSIASDVNVVGPTVSSATIGRRWKPFMHIPGNVFAYQSFSPIHPWTKPGDYPFDNAVSVALRHLKSPVSMDVPVQGTATIVETPITITCDISDIDYTNPDKMTVVFRITNAVVDGVAHVKTPKTIPVHVTIRKGTDFIPDIGIKANLQAYLVGEVTESAEYHLEMPLVEYLRPSNAVLQLDFTIEDADGQVAKISSDYVLRSSDRTIYDDMQLTAAEGYAPLPWLLSTLKLKNPAKITPFIPYLTKGKYNFAIEMGFGGEPRKFSLMHNPSFNRLDGDQILVPLMFSHWAGIEAESYIRDGGQLMGSITFKVPIDELHPDKSPQWTISIKQDSPQLRVAGVPGYPRPERVIREVAAREEGTRTNPFTSPDRPAVKTPQTHYPTEEDVMRFIGSGFKVVALEETAQAGKEFHLHLMAPSRPKAFTFEALHITGNPAATLRAVFTNPESERGVVYRYGAVAIKKTLDGAIATFKVPDFLPEGNYRVQLEVSKPIGVTYTVYSYVEDNPFTNTANVRVFDHRIFSLDLTAEGQKGVGEAGGEGGLIKE